MASGISLSQINKKKQFGLIVTICNIHNVLLQLLDY